MEILTLPLFLADSSALPGFDSVAACSWAHPLAVSIAGHRTIHPLGTFRILSCCFNLLSGSQSCAGAWCPSQAPGPVSWQDE